MLNRNFLENVYIYTVLTRLCRAGHKLCVFSGYMFVSGSETPEIPFRLQVRFQILKHRWKRLARIYDFVSGGKPLGVTFKPLETNFKILITETLLQ